MKRDTTVDQYLDQAQGWELDRSARAERHLKIAWGVAAFAGVVALAAVVAVVGLTPLKQTVPYVIRVDSSTGIVDVVPDYEGTGDVSEVVTRTLLNSYVIAHERYFYGTAEADYEQVAAQNTPRLNQAWSARWDRSNPDSPINLYKDGTSIRAQIRAISFLKLGSGRKVAQVRFTRFMRPGGSGDEQPSYWVATIDYAYTQPSSDEKLRSLNPLGFKVLEYQREPEVAGEDRRRG
jgi:type IV secretion system protein VirB8